MTLEVAYDLGGESAETMKEQLQGLVDRAVANGELSGNTSAIVETWTASVVNDTEVGDTGDNNNPDVIGVWLRTLSKGSHVYIDDDGLRLRVVGQEAYIELGGYTPEEDSEQNEAQRIPLPVYVFVENLERNSGSIDPEEAFREVCLEQDGIGWRRAQIAQHGYERYCKLELEDKPAFRQGLNDYADDMVKGRSWVTFNNGETYFTDEAIKEAIQAYDESEYAYVPELREQIEFWL